MKALKKHRESFPGKSDEWLFERLDLELKSKVETIHDLLDKNRMLEDILSEFCDCQDYERGLVSNTCPVHNKNPFRIEQLS